jgi:hypothetical protein
VQLLPVQVHPEPVMDTSVMPLGSVSMTVTVPAVGRSRFGWRR